MYWGVAKPPLLWFEEDKIPQPVLAGEVLQPLVTPAEFTAACKCVRKVETGCSIPDVCLKC